MALKGQLDPGRYRMQKKMEGWMPYRKKSILVKL